MPSAFAKPDAPEATRPAPPASPTAPVGQPSSAFRRVVDAQQKILPTRVVLLPAAAWNRDYPGAPGVAVEVGLRLYSEAEAVQARAAAAQRAWRLHPQAEDEQERVLAGNGALMAWLLARCATKPGDRRIPFFGGPQGGAEDVVSIALTPAGVEHLYEELDRTIAAERPTSPEASDQDIERLVAALRAGALGRLSVLDARRARRALAAAIDWLRLP